MKRREFITLLGGAAITWPLAARAQQPAMPVIGFLDARSLDVDADLVAAIRQGLTETGYVEGRNLRIEYRWAEGQINRLPALATDLVGRRVAVIMTGGNAAAPAAKAATKSIPIVFSTGDDPVTQGLVDSLSRPGGNLTGVTTFARALVTKRLGLLQELAPQATTIALLVNPDDPTGGAQTIATETAARAIGRQLVVMQARSEREIDAAFMMIVERQVGALLIGSDAFLRSRRNQIVALTARYALPTMHNVREDAEAGGLISYGADFVDGYRKVGVYAGRILKGEKPADLPIQQPTKFQLVINLKTAKALGLTVPPNLLATADEVIE
jgi:putative tryptophan/tyrosine transport system substrate-binding protein